MSSKKSLPGQRSQGLAVFVSSSIKEFENERVRLEKEIEEIGFLTPIVLERGGARPKSVLTESLTNARESDIFVGIFGKDFSDLTAKEFRQAFEARKPCLIYLAKVKDRDLRLEKFIADEVRPFLKYQEFVTTSELVISIRSDLTSFLGEVLRRGIEAWMGEHRKVVQEAPQIMPVHKKPMITKEPAPEWQHIFGRQTMKPISVTPQWLRILAILANGPSSMVLLTMSTGIYGPVLWMRLRDLEIKGLVVAERQGKRAVYRITERGLAELKRRYGNGR